MEGKKQIKEDLKRLEYGYCRMTYQDYVNEQFKNLDKKNKEIRVNSYNMTIASISIALGGLAWAISNNPFNLTLSFLAGMFLYYNFKNTKGIEKTKNEIRIITKENYLKSRLNHIILSLEEIKELQDSINYIKSKMTEEEYFLVLHKIMKECERNEITAFVYHQLLDKYSLKLKEVRSELLNIEKIKKIDSSFQKIKENELNKKEIKYNN